MNHLSPADSLVGSTALSASRPPRATWGLMVIAAAMLTWCGCLGSDDSSNGSTAKKTPSPDSATVPATDSPSLPDDPNSPQAGSGDTVAAPVAVGEGPATLGLGDKAPALVIDTWLKGQEVAKFEPGKVYVVEFWATWCGPCRTSMPHMAELQKQYQDKVHFIGVTNESSAEVEPFMAESAGDGKTWDDVVTYTIALDKNQETTKDYMVAAKLQGIPNAFIVGKTGLIEWIGHPMGMDETLEQVVEGTWDLEKVKVEFALETTVREAMMARQESILKAKDLAAAATGEEADKHWDGALATVDELLAMVPADASSPRLRGARDEMYQVKQWLLGEAGRTEELSKFQTMLVDDNWENPQMLDSIAWRIASSEKEGNLELAAKAASQAAKLTNNQNPSPLDTLARVYYEQGDLDLAIQWQTKAVAAAESSPAAKTQLESTLANYQAEKASAEEKGDPAKDAPAKDAPAKDAPAKDAPAKDAPAKDAPAKDAPAKDAPAKDAPAKGAPAKDAPAKDAPAKDAPAKDAPAKDAPAKDAPAKDAPAKDGQVNPQDDAPKPE